MGCHLVVERLGRYKELALATVFVFMAAQEFLEVLSSNRPQRAEPGSRSAFSSTSAK